MMKKLHIAIIHDSKIPAFKYGGTERVVWWLGEALTSLGHKVSYIVPPKSQCPFADVIEFQENLSANQFFLKSLIPADVDIVHSFTTINDGLKNINKPLIFTIGGNGQIGETYHQNTVFVSRNHALRHGSESFVYNGINPKYYPDLNESDKEPFCYFLANAKWKVKNVKGAIKIAKKAQIPIKIMGGKSFSLSKKVKWMGMVGGDKKNDTLNRGSALLFPVMWHEPFGIAIVEAMLTGSPVFGTPYGSLPELINEDVGCISNSLDELTSHLKNYSKYCKKTCRGYVLQNFTHLHMAEKYLDYYEHILKGKFLSKTNPRTLEKFNPGKLFKFNELN